MMTPQFNRGTIASQLKIVAQRHDAAIIRQLNRIGLQFVINARTLKGYIDQSGNLTSSIGYAVVKDGRVLQDDFQPAGIGTDQETGVAAAKKLVGEVKSQFPSGFVLIVVAGMDYAAAVEAMGKDVLTNSSKIAQAAFKKFQQDVNKINL